MTVYPPLRDKAACEECEWSAAEKSRKRAKAAAFGHHSEQGHLSYDINGYRLRFEGEQ